MLGYEQLAVRWYPYSCAFVLQYYHLRRRCMGTCEIWAVQGTNQGFSTPGVACGAKGGTADFRPTTSGAAQTSPPEGVFRHILRSIDELLGRTTGRLRCDRQDSTAISAYAIGGTAELAVPGTAILQPVSASDDQTMALISDYWQAGLLGQRSSTHQSRGPFYGTTGRRKQRGGAAEL